MQPPEPLDKTPEPQSDDMSLGSSTPPINTGAVINPSSSTPAPTIENPLHDIPASEPPQPSTIPAPSSEIQPAYPLVSGNTMNLSAGSKKSRKLPGKKTALLITAVATILIGGGAAAYFGYYVPNKPENLWKAALTNTGKGYDKLSEYTTADKKAKGVNIKGSFKLSGFLAADGNFSGSSSDKNSQFNGSVSATGLKVGFDVRTVSTGEKTTPDVYFKLDGLQDLGSLAETYGANGEIKTALNSLNGKWYFVDHTLFDQFSGSGASDAQITTDDVNKLLKTVGDTSKKYVFTDNTEKMAVVVKRSVGKEKQDGRSVYHYKVAFDKENLKSYFEELCNNLKSTKLGKTFGEGLFYQSSDCKQVAKDVDKIDESKTADAWVDTKTRLIHKVRFTEKNKADNYFDIVQNYTGGDNFPFSLVLHSKDGSTTSEGKVQMNLNMKTNVFSLNGTFKSSYNGKEEASGNFDLTVSPNNNDVKVEKPADAKTIIQLLNDIGLGELASGASGSSGGSGTTAAKARDSERKNDILALRSQVELYWGNNTGNYPKALSDITDLPADACKAPGGSGTCKNPDYQYRAFKKGTAVNAQGKTDCNNTSIDCASYIIFSPSSGTGAMETIANPYSVTSN